MSWIADFYNHRVHMFSRIGDSLAEWGGKEKGTGQFDGPTDLAVDEQGKVYIVDWGNYRIQIFQN
jgi:tripartite motif-containing protein 2/3/tripartite motif-containing protein 71